jgi:hypothetical protein
MRALRFAPRTPAHAPETARWRIVVSGVKAGIGERVQVAIAGNKKAGRAAPPGESLFSSLFNVAARGGKSPRVSIVF